MMKALSHFSKPVMLRNGSPLLIRAIRSDDKHRLREAFHRLSGKSVYFRFFTDKKELTEKDLQYFTEIDFENHVAIVATIKDGKKEKLIGVGRYLELKKKGQKRIAEVAFAVDDEYQHIGIGTILFEQIMTIAKNNGISALEADLLRDNKNMMEIFERSGFELKTAMKRGVVHIEIFLEDQ